MAEARPDDWNVRRMLDISTGHLTLETRNWLDELALVPADNSFTVADTGYGWFVTVPEDDDEDCPEDLKAMLAYARQNHCTCILIDRDGDPVEELTYYEEGSADAAIPAE